MVATLYTDAYMYEKPMKKQSNSYDSRQIPTGLEVLHVWPWQGEKGMELEKAFLLYTIPTYFTTHKFAYQVWNYLFSLLKQQECKIGSGSDVLYELASFSYFFPPTSLRDWLWVQQEEKSIISSGVSFLKDIHVRLFAANSFFLIANPLFSHLSLSIIFLDINKMIALATFCVLACDVSW